MSTRAILAFLFASSALLGLLYLWVTPPWMGPDEPRHYEYVRLLFDKRKLVGWADADRELEREIIASMRRHQFERIGMVHPELVGAPLPDRFADIWGAGLAHELHQPPLAYLVYAMALVPVADESIERQLLALRALSLLIGLATAWVAMVALVRLWPEDRFVGVGAAALVALLPQRLWLSVTVNNDHLTIFWGVLLFAVLVNAWRQGYRWWHLPVTVAVVGLALLTKRTGVVLGGLLAGALLSVLLMGNARHRVLPGLVGILVIGLTGILLGPAFWQRLTAQVPGLEKAGATFVYIYFGHVFDPLPQFRYQLTPVVWFTPEELPFWMRYLRFAVESFWGRFGWLNVWLGTPVRVALGVLTGLGLVGAVVQGLRALRGSLVLQPAQRRALSSGLVALIIAVAMMFQRLAQDWAAGVRTSFQMRFLFPILPLLALYLLWGLAAWVPVRKRLGVLGFWLAGLVLLNLYAIFLRLIPTWQRFS